MKIFHISDLHFGFHDEAITSCFLQEIMQEKPNILIVSGDLTHRATIRQYVQLQQFLQHIPHIKCIVPGNHDIPLHNMLRRFLTPFKRFKKFVSPQLFTQYQHEDVRILGVNSATPFLVKDGFLSATSLQRIDDFFSPEFSGINILFFHHNFDYLEGLHKPLKNYPLFLRHLKQSPIHLVCTGHLHYAHIGILKKNKESYCLALHAGSLSCKRSKDGLNSYYCIDIQNQNCTIQWRIFKKTGFTTYNCYQVDFSKPFSSVKDLFFI